MLKQLQVGWKVRVNTGVVVLFATNLYTDSLDGIKFVVEGIGSGVDNRTADVTIIESTVEIAKDYDGWIRVDSIGGVSGTTYPTGTAAQPVDNMIDAITLCSQYGFHQIEVKGTVPISTCSYQCNY